MAIKTIKTGGVTGLEPLRGSGRWYWGSDYTAGDLYEAEELFRMGHPIRRNRLVFVHGPTGRVVEPLQAAEGQYFGRPVYEGGRLVILLADFPAGELRLLGCDEESAILAEIVRLPLTAVPDCYNLMPSRSPLMLTRQAGGRFQIVWPTRSDFSIGPTESFCLREGDDLYFSRWLEDPDYREEIVVRRFDTGQIVKQFPGTLDMMPGGQDWMLL